MTHHCNDQSCSCCGKGECCGSSSCQCSSCLSKCHGHDSFAKELLKLADEAWMEVLKDKIKEQIQKANGADLDNLAKLVSDSNGNRWKHKMGAQKANQDFESKLNGFFCSEGKK